jgi:hypothetical protein
MWERVDGDSIRCFAALLLPEVALSEAVNRDLVVASSVPHHSQETQAGCFVSFLSRGRAITWRRDRGAMSSGQNLDSTVV